jgi:hypothetical protein
MWQMSSRGIAMENLKNLQIDRGDRVEDPLHFYPLRSPSSGAIRRAKYQYRKIDMRSSKSRIRCLESQIPLDRDWPILNRLRAIFKRRNPKIGQFSTHQFSLFMFHMESSAPSAKPCTKEGSSRQEPISQIPGTALQKSQHGRIWPS